MKRAAAFAFAVLACWFLAKTRGDSGSAVVSAKIQSGVSAQTNLNRAPAQSAIAAVPANAAQNSQGSKSLEEMAATLARFAKPKPSLRDLVDLLQDQKPVVTYDKNPATGEMAIVRTRQPLAGTRYFHAQFFNGDDGQPFVQHMSFEFKPGPQAMSEALNAVQTAFNVNQPKSERDGYALWDLPDGHILWVKKLDADDLKDDPFNAYDQSDVGTVRVAIEAEIH